MMTCTPSLRIRAIIPEEIFTTEVEVDECDVRQAFSHKFRGFCRCRCRSRYVGPQKLKVLF